MPLVEDCKGTLADIMCKGLSHRFKGFPAAICINGWVGRLLVLVVALMVVQQGKQLLPTLAVHNLCQEVSALAETLASLCRSSTKNFKAGAKAWFT